MKLFIIVSIFVSIWLMIASHPAMMVMMICAQSLMVSMTIMLLASTPWFAMILFLIFMGGLMVLFTYVTSLASNEMFETLNNKMTSTFISFIISGGLIIYMMELSHPNFLEVSFKLLTAKVYSKTSFMMTLCLVYYLLFTMIVAAALVSMYEGPLRSLLEVK